MVQFSNMFAKEGICVFDFERPNIEVAEISEDKKYGKFVVEPLERGYGITLGNSLRRIMLSSLPGAQSARLRSKVFCMNLVLFPV